MSINSFDITQALFCLELFQRGLAFEIESMSSEEGIGYRTIETYVGVTRQAVAAGVPLSQDQTILVQSILTEFQKEKELALTMRVSSQFPPEPSAPPMPATEVLLQRVKKGFSQGLSCSPKEKDSDHRDFIAEGKQREAPPPEETPPNKRGKVATEDLYASTAAAEESFSRINLREIHVRFSFPSQTSDQKS